MPELATEQIYIKDKAQKKVNIDYSSAFLEDNLPYPYPSPVAWNLENFGDRPTAMPISIPSSGTSAESQEDKQTVKTWTERKDPFTQTNLVDNEDDQTEELIYRIKTSLYIPNAKRIANRLITLFNDAKEEEPSIPGIAIGSLRNFYTFLHLHTNLKCPSLSLTPECNIYASWREKPRCVFSVLFESNRNVCFVIFKPNDKHPEKQMRFSGTATSDILMDTITQYGVYDWITE